ncbi:hypothetical protein TVAG_212610 [Trichomonas vaginalis G3]|uniref:Uncharacterized protein n=1 Tax=Trichomonas vaginalis (strain ATCC PRA-98 / G3) TaxID=412133 RepID=A2E2Q1_TRIV3|nr:armadillo (ARM) repeat-containing protein family [Trichomonas vaginalis G3]EAY13079.1 hypothetical protein TVAG_212610 [Trichomonas vaginalis G3]KAI5548267.1 armadillo (ARM) repeat-containing protein family [Trichomonas vaginalis G3]|eukprot:XP_001325302.1 hypothetical protein [Trichomonas vaginalis G3]
MEIKVIGESQPELRSDMTNIDLNDMKPEFEDTDSLAEIYSKINNGYHNGNFDLFFENFELLVSVAQEYVICYSKEFSSYEIEIILINLLQDENVDAFIKKSALKIIFYLIKPDEYKFKDIFLENDLIQILHTYIAEINAKLLKWSLKILMIYADYSERTAETIKNEIEFDILKNLIIDQNTKREVIVQTVRLIYSLMKYITNEDDLKIIIELSAFISRFDNDNISTWGLWILCMSCKSEILAEQIIQIENLPKIITKFISSSNPAVIEPALTLIEQIHTYIDSPIPNFEYKILLEFLDPTCEERRFAEHVAAIFANIMTDPEATAYFVNEGFMIFFFEAFETGSFQTRKNIIDYVFNCIQTVPSSLAEKIIDDGVCDVIISALEMPDSEILAKVLSCIITLLKLQSFASQFDEKVNAELFDTVIDDESDHVQQLYSEFIELYPKYKIDDN